MDNFSQERHGYSMSEVDNFIKKMRQENEEKLREQRDQIFELKNEINSMRVNLGGYVDKESHISAALVSAVEKAKQIEESARTLYQLEIKRIHILYRKWENLLEQIRHRFGNSIEADEVSVLIQEFQNAINTTLNTDQAKMAANEEKSYAKTLLSRMGGTPVVLAEKTTRPKLREEGEYHLPKKQIANEDVRKQYIEETDRLTLQNEPKSIYQGTRKPEIHNVLADTKPLKDIKTSIESKGPNLVDEFLVGQEAALPKTFGKVPERNAYFDALLPSQMKNFLNDKTNGFDLREAVNPTDSLEDIMKAFDFYESDNIDEN